jgi:hypothetical protein
MSALPITTGFSLAGVQLKFSAVMEARSYLSYSDQVFAYSEQLAKQTIGYEPKQILLLHGNQLEADHIGELLDVMRKRGYHFITLADALSDQAYGLPDTYVGEEGTGLARSLGDRAGQAPATTTGISAMGD